MKTTRQIRLANIRNSFDIREILYRSGVYFNIFFAQHSSFICAAQREDSWRVDRERNLACKRNKFLSILDISARSSVESSKGVLLDKDKVQEVNLYIYIHTRQFRSFRYSRVQRIVQPREGTIIFSSRVLGRRWNESRWDFNLNFGNKVT